MDMAMEAFWKVLGVVEEEMFHDPLGCSKCQVQGVGSTLDVVATIRSTTFMYVWSSRSVSV